MKSIKASPQEYDELGFNPKEIGDRRSTCTAESFIELYRASWIHGVTKNPSLIL